MRGLIVGAGIGGMAAAHALRQAGVEVTVLERGADPTSVVVGGSIHLWPNATRALARIGLGDVPEQIGDPVESILIRTSDGRKLMEVDVAGPVRELGAPAVGVTRKELQQVLLDAVGADTIRFGARATGFRQDAEGVTVELEGGEAVRGDVLVGADGLKSIVRAGLFGAGRLRSSGSLSYSAIVDWTENTPHRLTIVFGRGTRFVYYPLTRGRMSFHADIPFSDGASDRDVLGVLRRTFAGWGDPVEPLIERADPLSISVQELFDRPPDRVWTVGRVTLLGDAAHPMYPYFAQGACQALEDAAVLGAAFADADGNAPAALDRYQHGRLERAHEAQRKARRLGAAGHIHNPLLRRLRDFGMRRANPQGDVRFWDVAL